MKKNIALQRFIQTEVICDFLWKKQTHFEKSHSAKHTAVLACIWFMRYHLKLDEVNIQVLLLLHDIFHSLCTHRHRIMSGSLQAKTLFSTFTISSPVLERYPTTHRKSIVSLYNCSASSYSTALYTEPCSVWWYIQGNEQLHINARNTHFVSYLISEWAQPPAYSCLTMKTIHSAS